MTEDFNTKGDILLVDDYLDNLHLLANMLMNHGYEVRQVLNGQQALKVIEYEPPDLILLDIMMQGMSGYDVCEKLKQNPSTKKIPIIFISAKTDFLDKVKAFQTGGVDYIIKPFFLAEVLCRVETHLTIYNHEKILAQELEERKKIQMRLEATNNQLIQEVTQRKKIQTQLEKANKELEVLATIDGLTKIANRRRFDEYIIQEWNRLKREKQPLSLIMIDVDYFKLYNDTYGHLLGDECLKKIAQAINKIVKRPADLFTRYGGEEFALILPNTPSCGAVNIAKNIFAMIESLKIMHERSFCSKYVTLSLGITTMIPDNKLSFSVLVNKADKALFQAKKEGRNRFVVNL